MWRRKISRISSRLRWIAGTRMCDGRSSASWTISSARSVSSAAMPWLSRCSLRPISCVAIDLTLRISSLPVALTSRVTISLASTPSRAQWTVPPRSVTFRSSSSSSSGSRFMVSVLIAEPVSRSCSQSGSSPVTARRLARMEWVALPRLRRSCSLPSSSWAARGKVRSPRRWPVPYGERGGTAGIPRKVSFVARPVELLIGRPPSGRGARCGWTRGSVPGAGCGYRP